MVHACRQWVGMGVGGAAPQAVALNSLTHSSQVELRIAAKAVLESREVVGENAVASRAEPVSLRQRVPAGNWGHHAEQKKKKHII